MASFDQFRFFQTIIKATSGQDSNKYLLKFTLINCLGIGHLQTLKLVFFIFLAQIENLDMSEGHFFYIIYCISYISERKNLFEIVYCVSFTNYYEFYKNLLKKKELKRYNLLTSTSTNKNLIDEVN